METVIGKIIIGENVEKTNLYECAAWYQKVLLTPGEYPLVHKVYMGQAYITATVPGIVTGSNFSSLFAGSPIPGGSHVDEDKGNASKYVFRPYAFNVANEVLHGGQFGEGVTVQLAEGFEAGSYEFDYENGKGEVQVTTCATVFTPEGQGAHL